MEESDTRSFHSEVNESYYGGQAEKALSFAPSHSIAERSRTILDAKRLEHFEHTVALLSKETLVLMDILVIFLQELKTILHCQGVNAYILD